MPGRGGRGLVTRLGVCGGLTRSQTDKRWKEGTTWSSSTGLGVRGSLLEDKVSGEGRNFFGGSL